MLGNDVRYVTQYPNALLGGHRIGSAEPRMNMNWNRPHLIPTDALDDIEWKAKPDSRRSVTVEMKRPTNEEIDNHHNAVEL